MKRANSKQNEKIGCFLISVAIVLCIIGFFGNYFEAKSVKGKVVVVTKGNDVVKMFNVKVWAVEEKYLKKEMLKNLALVKNDIKTNGVIQFAQNVTPKDAMEARRRLCRASLLRGSADDGLPIKTAQNGV